MSYNSLVFCVDEVRRRREFAAADAARLSASEPGCAATTSGCAAALLGCAASTSGCAAAVAGYRRTDKQSGLSRCFIYTPTDQISIGLQHRDRQGSFVDVTMRNAQRLSLLYKCIAVQLRHYSCNIALIFVTFFMHNAKLENGLFL